MKTLGELSGGDKVFMIYPEQGKVESYIVYHFKKEKNLYEIELNDYRKIKLHRSDLDRSYIPGRSRQGGIDLPVIFTSDESIPKLYLLWKSENLI